METRLKAEELVKKFMEVPNYARGHEPEFDKKYRCKQCALICVDEIRKSLLITEKVDETEYEGLDTNGVIKDQYWQEVKQQIKEL